MQRTIRQLHKCEYCGAEFRGTAKAKYCSTSCRTLAYRAKKSILSADLTIEEDIPLSTQRKCVETIKTAHIGEIKQTNAVGTVPNMSIKELLIAGAVYWGINAIFNPPKRRYKKK